MATLFWVGGTGTFDGTTNHFATSTGGSATVAAVTSSDDVTIDSASGSGTMTIGATFSCNTLTINSSTMTVACDGTHGITAVGAVTLTLGTLNTNGQTCSWGTFSSTNSNTRTLTLGASAITITSGASSAWSSSTTTGLTVTANTAVVTFTGSGSTNTLFSGTTFNYNGLSITYAGSGTPVFTFGTCGNFTRTGTAVKTDGVSFANGSTITGTLTLNGNSTTNRLFVLSSIVGTARILTAATVSCSNADFQDITGAGAGSWDLSAITGLSGDCGGNSGITFTTAAPQTFQGTTSGSWSNSGKWTSRVPLPQDNVAFGNAFSASQTITADMPRLGANIDFTGTTGTSLLWSRTVANTIYGSLTLIANISGGGGVQTLALQGRTSCTVTSAGNSITGNLTINAAPSGTYTAQDALTCSGSDLQLSGGTFTANSAGVTCGHFVSSNNVTRVLNMGTGTWTLSGTGFVWNIQNTATITINASTSVMTITDTSSTSKTFAGLGKTYSTLRHTATGSAALTFTGNNTFDTLDLECSTARTITFPASGTQTVNVLTIQGASGQVLSLVSSTPSTSTTINVSRAYTKNFDSESADVILNLPTMGGGGGVGPGLRLVRKGF